MIHKTNKSGIGKKFYKIFVATGIVGILITSIVSLYISFSNNAKLEDLEKQKYEYTLLETRFEKLQESLEYFTRFSIIKTKYINRFDILSKDYSPFDILDMVDDSRDEFRAQVEILLLYMSDEAIIKMAADGILDITTKSTEFDVGSIANMSIEEANNAIKEYLRLQNEDYDYYADIIIDAIKYDIKTNYIPTEEKEVKIMDFENLLATYPVLDIAWELFKGISPTVIAVLTIAANNRLSKKRAKEEMILNEIRELQLRVAEFVPRIMDMRRDVEDMISYLPQKEKLKEMVDDMYRRRKQLQLDAAQILAYANIRANIIECDAIRFNDVCKKINHYCTTVKTILNWYESEELNKAELKEKVDDEIKKVWDEVLDAILNYGKKI